MEQNFASRIALVFSAVVENSLLSEQSLVHHGAHWKGKREAAGGVREGVAGRASGGQATTARPWLAMAWRMAPRDRRRKTEERDRPAPARASRASSAVGKAARTPRRCGPGGSERALQAAVPEHPPGDGLPGLPPYAPRRPKPPWPCMVRVRSVPRPTPQFGVRPSLGTFTGRAGHQARRR